MLWQKDELRTYLEDLAWWIKQRIKPGKRSNAYFGEGGSVQIMVLVKRGEKIYESITTS
jgi:hypothetical protein